MKQFILSCTLTLFFFSAWSQILQPEIVEMTIKGATIESHFFPGYSNMQFSNADLDNDGREDLVVFDRQSVVVSTFLWDEASNGWQFSDQHRKAFPDDLRNWMLMRDYNNDGIADIFTSKYVSGSGIRVFKGVRNNGELTYQPVLFYDAARDKQYEGLHYRNQSGDLRNLVVLTADVPAIADVDFDGDLDVLVFHEAGNSVYYVKNVAVESGLPLDSMRFQLEDRCWGGFAEDFLSADIYTSEAPGVCSNQLSENPTEKKPLHASSAINVFDVDGDEDMDIFIGDDNLDKLTFLRNEQSADGVDWCNEQTLDFPENDVPIQMDAFLVPFFVNIDDDPEIEMIVSSNQLNNSKNVIPMLTYDSKNGEFVKRNNDWLELPKLDVGSKSHPALADVNQDGLLDLVVGNYLKYTNDSKTSLHLFINTSKDGKLSFELQDEDWLDLSDQNDLNTQFKPAFGDLDQDGDQDLILGQVAGELEYFENIAGEGEPFDFKQPRDLYDARGTNAEAAPQIIDLDGDGLNDVVVGNALGTLEFIRNTGEAGNPEFAPGHPENIESLGNVRVVFPDSFFLGNSTPFFVVTDEGLRCFVGNNNGDIKQFSDIAASRDPWTEEPSIFNGVFEGYHATLAMGDIDNDGRLEAVIGNITGGLVFYETDFTSNNDELLQPTKADQLLVFPNPADDFVIISVQKDNYSDLSLDLYDINGHLVHQQELFRGENRLNQNGWPSGVYFYSIKNNTGQLKHGKLIWK